MKYLVVIIMFLAGQVFAGEDARAWLDKMSDALKSLDYDGTFVYHHGGMLEAMRIIHRVDDGGQRERLVSLTGSAREVLRDGRIVTCILPDNKSVTVGQGRPPQPFPVVPENLGKISRYYQLEDEGDDRMVGYKARVIAVKPKDKFRYGYRFWIENESGMLLKSDLTGVDGTPIEQVMFTSLAVGIDIPAAHLEPSLTGDEYTWYRQSDIGRTPDTPVSESAWVVGRLPNGFMLTNYQRSRMHEQAGDAEHMVFSDGMATVSVYVEKSVTGATAFTGLSSMGAMNAYGALIDGFQVTVVGEVPPATVEMMATSVTRTNPD